VGEAMAAHRAETYAALFDHGILPAVDAPEGETTGGLLRRAFEALAARHAAFPFSLGVEPFSKLRCDFDDYGDYDEDDENIPHHASLAHLRAIDPVCLVVQVADGWATVRATDFDRTLSKYDRELSAALLEHVRRLTKGTFDAFTPGSAFDYAEWGMFHHDRREWWQEQRAEAARELGIKPRKLTGKQLRAYVRQSGVRTPGLIDRILGRHHRSVSWGSKLLSLTACERRIARVPQEIRDRAQTVVTGLRALEPAARALAAAQRPEEDAILHAFGTSGTMPGLIVENSGEENLVVELLNDHWEYACQDRGFGPNYVLVLDETEGSCHRLACTLEHLTTATNAVTTIIHALDPDL
jgi:hypothetical protein